MSEDRAETKRSKRFIFTESSASKKVIERSKPVVVPYFLIVLGKQKVLLEERE